MVLATEATGLGGFLTVANGANSWYSCHIDSLLVGHGPSSSRYVGLFFTHIVSLFGLKNVGHFLQRIQKLIPVHRPENTLGRNRVVPEITLH